MSTYSIVTLQGQNVGPISEAEVREHLKNGTTSLDSLGWKPGMGAWAPLRSFTEFIDVGDAPVSQMVNPAGGPPPIPAAAGEYNPYAAPQSAAPFGYGPGGDSLTRSLNLTTEVLSMKPQVRILDCISRAWNLIFGKDFGSIIGVCALIGICMFVSSMCYAAIVVGGPLMAGCYYFLLKKIRGEHADVGTAFSAFSEAFLHSFLGMLVSSLLTAVGLVFCIIPGIYLGIAYSFTLLLIIDKKFEFWHAMECSRKVVTANFFPILGLMFLTGLLSWLGIFALLIGIFISIPIGLAAMAYAYEDMFNFKKVVGPTNNSLVGGTAPPQF